MKDESRGCHTFTLTWFHVSQISICAESSTTCEVAFTYFAVLNVLTGVFCRELIGTEERTDQVYVIWEPIESRTGPKQARRQCVWDRGKDLKVCLEVLKSSSCLRSCLAHLAIFRLTPKASRECPRVQVKVPLKARRTITPQRCSR